MRVCLSEALGGHYPFDLSPRLHSLHSLSLGLLRVCLSEAPCGFRSSAYPTGCTRFARLAWGYRKVNLSEAVRYPFNAWCLTAAGRGPRGRPQIYSYLNYYGRPQGPPPASGLNRVVGDGRFDKDFILRVVSGGCRARPSWPSAKNICPCGRPQTSSYLNYYGRPLTLPSRTLQPSV